MENTNNKETNLTNNPEVGVTETKKKTVEEITTEFFKRRFPNKNLELEKKVGYFGEWVRRFSSPNPDNFMDMQTLNVWKQMQKEGFRQ